MTYLLVQLRLNKAIFLLYGAVPEDFQFPKEKPEAKVNLNKEEYIEVLTSHL
jgi:hypothetical protein